MKSLPIKFIISMLNDDYGISEETWNELRFWLNAQYGSEVTAVLNNVVDATDGRFYMTKTVDTLPMPRKPRKDEMIMVSSKGHRQSILCTSTYAYARYLDMYLMQHDPFYYRKSNIVPPPENI